MRDSYENKASGQARVGGQFSVVHGPVTVGAAADAPESIADLLAEVRRALDAARGSGALDEATFAAAKTELAVAGAAAAGNDAGAEGPAGEAPRGHRMVLALTRLRGHVADSAELAAKVAVAIAAVKGAV